jgi:TRAP-type mannitol/chloroaromatic compound transport system substrate-binding protein
MYHTYEGYFEKKSPAFHFFAAIPYGFTADELFAWVEYGGGQELWDALSGQFTVKSLLCTSTGCQMGGWFAHEITSPEGFRGLRFRMAGPGAQVLRRLGATVVVVPGGQSMQTLKSGAIEGSEWVGPWLDMASACTQRRAITIIRGFTSRAPTSRSADLSRKIYRSYQQFHA